jgi:hypothetical protein
MIQAEQAGNPVVDVAAVGAAPPTSVTFCHVVGPVVALKDTETIPPQYVSVLSRYLI